MFPEIPELRHRRRPKDTVSKKQLEMQGYTPITGTSKTCQESLDVDVEDRRACGALRSDKLQAFRQRNLLCVSARA